jgi:hypothetical protein
VVVETARPPARSRLARLLSTLRRARGVSSAGRAPALQAGGHRFDPDTLHFERAWKQATFSRRSICGSCSTLRDGTNLERPSTPAPHPRAPRAPPTGPHGVGVYAPTSGAPRLGSGFGRDRRGQPGNWSQTSTSAAPLVETALSFTPSRGSCLRGHGDLLLPARVQQKKAKEEGEVPRAQSEGTIRPH